MHDGQEQHSCGHEHGEGHDHSDPHGCGGEHDLDSQHEPGDHATTHPAPTTVGALVVELREHVPFSVTAVVIGLMLAGVLCVLASAFGGEAASLEHAGHDHAGDATMNPYGVMFFHLFHPAHMLFSAAATTAMFVRYEKKFIKAMVIGLLGATIVCGLSDIAMPQISLWILGAHVPLHLCIVHHPDIVVPFALVGVLIGVWAAGGVQRSTIMYHSMHVFASTMATIFYMVSALGLVDWIDQIGRLFLFIIPAVVVPCCLSDIVFPMLMARASREKYFQTPHVH